MAQRGAFQNQPTIRPSDAAIQGCFHTVAVTAGIQVCLQAPSPDLCVVAVAEDRNDPGIITAYVNSKYPDYQASRYDEYMNSGDITDEVMYNDRNDLMATLAGAYMATTSDFSMLDQFDEIYESWYRDQVLQSSLSAITASTGFAPSISFCDNMSGGYKQNNHIIKASQTEEETYLTDRIFCEVAVASLRSLVYNDDRCSTELPGRLQRIANYTGEEADDVQRCLQMRADLKNKIQDLATAYLDSTGRTLADLQQKWLLTDTAVNPNHAKTLFQGGGSDPNYFPEERFKNKMEEFTISSSSMIFHDNDWDYGVEYFDATFIANFDAPPAVMTPGESFSMTATTSGSGFVSQMAGGWNSGITFGYSVDGGILEGDAVAGTNLDFIQDTANVLYTPPTAPEGTSMALHAFLWNCSACKVDWIYTMANFDVLDALIAETHDSVLNLADKKKYLDLTPTMPYLLNTLRRLSGTSTGEIAHRPGDITGNGRADIGDSIYFLQAMSK